MMLLTSLNRIAIDLREAFRGLRTGRGTTLLAFFILTLAMAAGTVTFSVVEGVALRPLPYRAPDRLVSITRPGTVPGSVLPSSSQDYFSYADGASTFEALGAARGTGSLLVETAGTSEALPTRIVTTNLFDLLGVKPALGRSFGPEHGRPGEAPTIILSHQVWSRRFGGDPSVIGRRLVFGKEAREIIGVLPEGVGYPITAGRLPDAYIPYVATPADRTDNRTFAWSVVGRLRQGVRLAEARADVQRIAPSTVIVQSLHDQVVGAAKSGLLLVLAGVAFVLLVACVNVASLLLSRATTRARELATRLALGASGGRLTISLLFEGLILALAASAVGTLVSIWGVEIAKINLPASFTRVGGISLHGGVLAVSIGAAIVCGLFFASAPAWLIARSDLVGLMKAGGSVIGGRRSHRSLSAFLVAEMAFVCALLVATTLVVSTLVVISVADLGFDRRNLVTISYSKSHATLPDHQRAAAAVVMRTDLLDRVRSLPGVTGAAISNAQPPLSGTFARYGIEIRGVTLTRDDMLETRMITPEYFQVLGMQLVRGRTFEATDRAGAPRVMVINDVAARRFFPERDPIGQVVSFRGPTTIVGITKSVNFGGPETAASPEMYTPIDQEPFRGTDDSGALVVRTNGEARALAATVRDAVAPALSASQVPLPELVEDHFVRLTAGRRFNATLMALFGVLALVIGAAGVYGTMAFLVSQQVRAIGLRMALGASPSRIMRAVLRDALWRVGAGIIAGLSCAWVTSSLFASLVFGIRPTSPLIYVAVAIGLGGIGLLAALIPARRAAHLDPVAALRSE